MAMTIGARGACDVTTGLLVVDSDKVEVVGRARLELSGRREATDRRVGAGVVVVVVVDVVEVVVVAVGNSSGRKGDSVSINSSSKAKISVDSGSVCSSKMVSSNPESMTGLAVVVVVVVVVVVLVSTSRQQID